MPPAYRLTAAGGAQASRRLVFIAASEQVCGVVRLRLVRQHDRLFALAVGDRPVAAEQPIYFRRREQLEPVALVEPDRPAGRAPGADEERPIRLSDQAVEQGRA